MTEFLATLADNAPAFGKGLLVTLALTLCGAAGAAILSFVFGLMALSRRVVVRGISRVIVEFFRGTSLYVQMFWLAFALPMLGFQLAPFACAVAALALNYGAYGSEVVRGAINAVPRGQWEATVALAMSSRQRMARVILPQAWAGMIPPFNNLLIQLIKSTPLAALILVFDLFYRAKQLRSSTGNTVATYLLVLVLYFVIAHVFTLLMSSLERSASARLGRPTRPGLWSMLRGAISGPASTPEPQVATSGASNGSGGADGPPKTRSEGGAP